jgi:hypothetical protein
MDVLQTRLRKETSLNCSGKILNENLIPELKEKNYYVKNFELDGDTPKQFIKAYFYEEDSGVKKASPKSWFSYIAKTAEKWYPHESVIEYMINRIGEEMGLFMNKIRLVKANKQIRFLSKYFLSKDDTLIHGAEICGEYLEDMELASEIAKHKPSARELFTFEFIREAIHVVFPKAYETILTGLVKMIAFDAIVGNNDRHFYNWGVIDTKKKTGKLPTFAPLYDSARGLLWNFSDQNVINYLQNYTDGGKKIVNYLQDACPRISIESNRQANHFELVEFVKRNNAEHKKIINNLASEETEEKVIKMLSKDFYPLLIPERRKLIEIILENRFKTVRSI